MRSTLSALAPLLAGLVVPLAQAEIQTFRLDNTHSFANWEIRHVVARTSGTFHDVQGKVVLDTADLAKSSVEATVSVLSLNSSHLKRDLHVLSEDYLGARDHPEMKFVSTRVNPITPEIGSVIGNLTLHGVTKPVTLDYQILGMGKDPWGGMRIGFKATTQLKRSDFGISKGLPYGPVGNEVEITLLMEGIRLAADGQAWNAIKDPPSKTTVFPMPVENVSMPTPIPPPITTPMPAPIPAGTLPQPAPAAVPAPPPSPPQAQPATPPSKENLREQLMREMLKELSD